MTPPPPLPSVHVHIPILAEEETHPGLEDVEGRCHPASAGAGQSSRQKEGRRRGHEPRGPDKPCEKSGNDMGGSAGDRAWEGKRVESRKSLGKYD